MFFQKLMNKNQNHIKNIATVSLLVVSFFLLGIYIGTSNKTTSVTAFLKTANQIDAETDLSAFWKVWSTIDKKFPDAEEVDSEKRIRGAIAGLVESLDDPYSVYFDPEETKEFKEEISGNFIGVGMEVGIKDGILTVISPLKDTPAYKAGILAGDRILKIDDKETNGMSAEQAVKLIRGEKGTVVTLIIAHKDSTERVEVKITRDVINIPTLDTELRPDGIFVIKLYTFSGNSVALFNNAMKEFINSKSDKLILDLRGNPGGYLDASVEMASWFLPTGKIVATEDFGSDKKPKEYRSLGYDAFRKGLKFVVLIDEGSASASEIFAGAMQDYKKAKIVGTVSYGKGSVQEVIKVTKDTILKLTIAKWLTPNGNSISQKGLTPDFEVTISKEDKKANRDPQMDKAVEVLKDWYSLK